MVQFDFFRASQRTAAVKIVATTIRVLWGIGVNWQMKRSTAIGNTQGGFTFSSDQFRIGADCTRA
jgi:hypothetical protein